MQTETRKRRITIVLSIILVAVLAIGATMAYLSATTGQAVNTFTFAENVKARLDEPNWDPDEGLDLTPGYEIKKDPIITNTSDNGIDEFVAIRLNFTDGAGNLLGNTDTNATQHKKYVGRLIDLIDISWNTNDWALLESSMADKAEQIWVFKSDLAPGEVTPALFSTVTIKTEADYIADYIVKNKAALDTNGNGTVEGTELDAIPDWNEEYAWLASIVMNHTDDCYEYGVHNGSTCTITYRHHENCPVSGEANEAVTGKGGVTNGKTCDCDPAQKHEEDCPYVVGTLKTGLDKCAHVSDGIDGFQIVVRGAVVQANVEGMTAWNSTATLSHLKTLFEGNAFVDPTPPTP